MGIATHEAASQNTAQVGHNVCLGDRAPRDALASELGTAKGASPLLDRAAEALLVRFNANEATDCAGDEAGARRLHPTGDAHLKNR